MVSRNYECLPLPTKQISLQQVSGFHLVPSRGFNDFKAGFSGLHSTSKQPYGFTYLISKIKVARNRQTKINNRNYLYISKILMQGISFVSRAFLMSGEYSYS